MKSDFFEAGDFQALAVFDDFDELAGGEEGVVGAGIEPGGAAAEEFDVEFAGFEVQTIEVGDLEFAAPGGFEGFGESDDVFVVEVEAGDGVVGFWLRRFFFQGNDAAIRGEFDDAVGGGIGDVIAEDRRAIGALGGVFEGGGEVVSVEEVVAQDEGGGRLVVEKADLIGDEECLGEAVGTGLFGVAEGEAELGAVAEEAFEEGKVEWSGDDQDLADAGQHEDRQRIVDHRLVVDGHQLFGDGDGEGIEAGAGAAGEDDAFAFHGGGMKDRR